MSLFDPVAVARNSDPTTSHKAAERVLTIHHDRGIVKP